jgi:hypothetical protein
MVENTDPFALHKLQQMWCKGVTVILFQCPGGWAEELFFSILAFLINI